MLFKVEITEIYGIWTKLVGEAQKLGQSCQKGENVVKNWYYIHFDPKKYTKIIK